jgi:hypothetical protein
VKVFRSPALPAALLAAAAAALGPAGAAAEPPVERERAIRAGRPGKVVVTLDRDVYEQARPDLGDLRVVDDQGADAPYLRQGMTDDLRPEVSFRTPPRLRRGFVRGQGATATLEFDAPVLKSELLLSLSGEAFRRRVKVEGKAKGDRDWTALTEGAYVLAVPGPGPARYETVFLPENNYPFLRLIVFPGPDDPERIDVLDVLVRPEAKRRPREIALSPGFWRGEDEGAHETLLVLDLLARHQPFRAVVLEVADAAFFRGAVLEARRDSLPGADGRPAYTWASVSEGLLYRSREATASYERVRLDAIGREGVLRLRIRNRDERPLEVKGATVMVPVERLVFDARPGRAYRLTYGVPGRSAPSYAIERTVGDAAIWMAQAAEAALEPPAPRLPSPARRSWLEDRPRLFWAALAALLSVLFAQAWRHRKRAA